MSYELIDNGSYLHIRFFGILESGDFARLFVDLRRLEDNGNILKHRITTLSDITDFIIQFSTMFPVAEERGRDNLTSMIKSAIVASRPVEVAIAGMLISMHSNPHITIRSFSKYSDAVAWVSEFIPSD